jgi:hypothetical protein
VVKSLINCEALILRIWPQSHWSGNKTEQYKGEKPDEHGTEKEEDNEEDKEKINYWVFLVVKLAQTHSEGHKD